MYSLTGPLLQLLWKRVLWNDYLIKLFRELKFRDVQEGWKEGNTEKENTQTINTIRICADT